MSTADTPASHGIHRDLGVAVIGAEAVSFASAFPDEIVRLLPEP